MSACKLSLFVGVGAGLASIGISKAIFGPFNARLLDRPVRDGRFQNVVLNQDNVHTARVQINRVISKVVVIFKQDLAILLRRHLSFLMNRTAITIGSDVYRVPILRCHLIVRLRSSAVNRFFLVEAREAGGVARPFKRRESDAIRRVCAYNPLRDFLVSSTCLLRVVQRVDSVRPCFPRSIVNFSGKGNVVGILNVTEISDGDRSVTRVLAANCLLKDSAKLRLHDLVLRNLQVNMEWAMFDRSYVRFNHVLPTLSRSIGRLTGKILKVFQPLNSFRGDLVTHLTSFWLFTECGSIVDRDTIFNRRRDVVLTRLRSSCGDLLTPLRGFRRLHFASVISTANRRHGACPVAVRNVREVAFYRRCQLSSVGQNCDILAINLSVRCHLRHLS